MNPRLLSYTRQCRFPAVLLGLLKDVSSAEISIMDLAEVGAGGWSYTAKYLTITLLPCNS